MRAKLHDWSLPIQEVAAHELPERKLVARAALKKLRSLFRDHRGQVRDKHVEFPAESITRILSQPPSLPRSSDFSRVADAQTSTNIGLEIEVIQVEVQARVGRSGTVVDNFLLKCMLYEQPVGFTGFSVQSDGGHIELVSDPPIAGLLPTYTAAEMARYIKILQKKLLPGWIKRNSTGPWMSARAAIAQHNAHADLSHENQNIRVLLKAADQAIDGVFHATVGLHLSALPWLFASGASHGEDPARFPLPGHVFRQSADCIRVLGQIEQRRRSAAAFANWQLSPAFVGVAYLIFAYLAAARTLYPVKTLSPKAELFRVG